MIEYEYKVLNNRWIGCRKSEDTEYSSFLRIRDISNIGLDSVFTKSDEANEIIVEMANGGEYKFPFDSDLWYNILNALEIK